MVSYYARFEHVFGRLFRFDTRIYLGEHALSENGVCVGAIVGKNPGSAKPMQLGKLAPLDLKGDKMLPSVRKRFVSAYLQAGKEIPENAFVQIWNLFYLCDPDLRAACSALRSLKSPPICSSENLKPKVVWFAWGDTDLHLNPLKRRFISRGHCGFYYDPRSKSEVSYIPSEADFAKHPQGLRAAPVVDHLADLL